MRFKVASSAARSFAEFLQTGRAKQLLSKQGFDSPGMIGVGALKLGRVFGPRKSPFAVDQPVLRPQSGYNRIGNRPIESSSVPQIVEQHSWTLANLLWKRSTHSRMRLQRSARVSR